MPGTIIDCFYCLLTFSFLLFLLFYNLYCQLDNSDSVSDTGDKRVISSGAQFLSPATKNSPEMVR